MMRLLLLAGALSGLAVVATPLRGAAQDADVRPGAETAANVVEAILSGRDDPAAWGALQAALGDDAVSTAFDERVPAGARGLPGAGPSSNSVERVGDEADGGARFPVAAPAWMEGLLTQRVAAGVVVGVLSLLVLFAVWQLSRLVVRAFRAVGSGNRPGRTLVRRRHQDVSRSRDAERLQAQLRARRAA